MPDIVEVAASGLVVAVVPVVTEVKTVVNTVVNTVVADVKPNVIVTFFKNVWAKIEAVDAVFNKWISNVTSGYTTIALVAIVVAYLLLPVTAILEFLLSVPAILIKFILDTLGTVVKFILDAAGVAVPFIFSAIPYILLAAVVLLLIVELKNLVTKITIK